MNRIEEVARMRRRKIGQVLTLLITSFHINISAAGSGAALWFRLTSFPWLLF